MRKNIEKAPAGAGTAAAVGKYREGSCWSGHCCGSGEILKRLLLQRALLRQRGNIEKAPAGAGTAAAVRKNSWGGIPVVVWGCWEREREWTVVGGLGDERKGGGGGFG